MCVVCTQKRGGGRVPSLNTGGFASFWCLLDEQNRGSAEFVQNFGHVGPVAVSSCFVPSHPLLLKSFSNYGFCFPCRFKNGGSLRRKRRSFADLLRKVWEKVTESW